MTQSEQTPLHIDVAVTLPPGTNPEAFREHVLQYIQGMCNGSLGKHAPLSEHLHGSKKLVAIDDEGFSLTYLNLAKVDMIIKRDNLLSLILSGRRVELKGLPDHVCNNLMEAWAEYNRSSR